MTRKRKIIHSDKSMFFGVIILSIFLCSCATKMVVTPEVGQVSIPEGFNVKGKIVYDGNKEYLPRTIADSSSSILIFQYSYNVTYGKDNMSQIIALYNPLTIVGFPIGENTLIVSGKLDIVSEKEMSKSYTSTCGFEVARNIFSEGETFSELRKKGLILVRDNIETQMYQERDFLSRLKTTE